MSESNIILSLPKDLIYRIAAEDAGVYNIIMRLCRHMAALFPLSIRLDNMIAFGVTVDIGRLGNDISRIAWYWNGTEHDIFGPAIAWEDGDIEYDRLGLPHRDHGPTRPWRLSTRWYRRGECYRNPTEPAGTGVEWLRGSVFLSVDDDIARVSWCNGGKTRFEKFFDEDKVAEVAAEIAYWYERRYD
jgi:hypothetical protein